MNTESIKVGVMRVCNLSREVTDSVAETFFVWVRRIAFAFSKCFQPDVFAPENGTVSTLVSNYVRPEIPKIQNDFTEFLIAPSVLAQLRSLKPAHGKSINDGALSGFSEIRLHTSKSLEGTKCKIIPTALLKIQSSRVYGLGDLTHEHVGL